MNLKLAVENQFWGIEQLDSLCTVLYWYRGIEARPSKLREMRFSRPISKQRAVEGLKLYIYSYHRLRADLLSVPANSDRFESALPFTDSMRISTSNFNFVNMKGL